MKVTRLFANWPLVHCCLAPDTGGGSGGDGGDGGAGGTGGDGDGGTGGSGDSPPTFTEEQVNKRIEESMKRWRKTLQKDNAAKDKTIGELQGQLTQLQEELAALKPKEGGEGDSKTVEGRIELLEKRHAKQLEEMQTKLKDEIAKREAAEQQACERHRDTQIFKALEAPAASTWTWPIRGPCPRSRTTIPSTAEKVVFC